jgi:hypothetical protein
MLRQRLQDVMRKNNYDPSSGRLMIEPRRHREVADYSLSTFDHGHRAFL